MIALVSSMRSFCFATFKTTITDPSLAIAFIQGTTCLADDDGSIATSPSSDTDKNVLRKYQRQLVDNLIRAQA